MKVLVIGATGLIGGAVINELSNDHEVIPVGNSRGELKVDLAEKHSIEALFEKVGKVDAIVCAAGLAAFGSLNDLTDEDFSLSVNNKMMGQANLVRVGRKYVSDGGSITLTTGALAQYPIEGSAAITMVNAALEGFVLSAALESENDIRVNAVSPGWIKETMDAMGMDSSNGAPASLVARSYRQSVEGSDQGKVISVS